VVATAPDEVVVGVVVVVDPVVVDPDDDVPDDAVSGAAALELVECSAA
jgi:hypothetical protein